MTYPAELPSHAPRPGPTRASSSPDGRRNREDLKATTIAKAIRVVLRELRSFATIVTKIVTLPAYLKNGPSEI